MNKIREYFYGTPKCELAPYSNLVAFEDVSIYRVGEGTMLLCTLFRDSLSDLTIVFCVDTIAPSSALPIGMTRKVSETQLVKVEAGDILLHSILAVSNAENEDETTLVESNIAGFIYV